MRSSEAVGGRARPGARAFVRALAACVVCASPSTAYAQGNASGFAVERFYASAPGGGWLVMEDLAWQPQLGGAFGFTTGYARDPLRSDDGNQRLTLVSAQAFADVGAAITFKRFRWYGNFTIPLYSRGRSGVVGGSSYAAPSLDLGRSPDTLSDTRVGFDAILLGDAQRAFRLGVGTQLFVPSGEREDYVTDGTYRAMGRVLVAGNVGDFIYAAHVGVHVRPRDNEDASGAPRGSELLVGVAAGPRFALAPHASFAFGPEVFGASALRALGNASTGVEALLTGRLEQRTDEGSPLVRLKLGVGGGLVPRFGTPAWRAVVSLEVTDHLP